MSFFRPAWNLLMIDWLKKGQTEPQV
ncbi:MAG: hypothetical protein RL268_2775, partial [Pseudomonadota bacterium]